MAALNGVFGGMFAVKPADALVKDASDAGGLRRAVGLFDLTALGLGAIIGTGIFVILGEAIGDAGPAIVLSFVLAGLTCAFSALSYSELAASIPVSGSAYTYAYATLGELVAWIIGWDLILEYGVSVAAVAVGWGQYLNSLLDSLFGVTIPDSLSQPPGEGGVVNLPAAFLVLAVAGLLILGIKESARVNSVMVVTKILVLLLFIGLAATAFTSGNMTPFTPHGFSGITTAASAIFFAYIGFDAVSTCGEEVKQPKRDLPLAIIGSLIIATILYCLVAIFAIGAYPWEQLAGKDAPLATVLSDGVGTSWGSGMISVGALIAITSVVLTILYGQTRIMYAMSRDGLVPKRFGKVSRRQTPAFVTAVFAVAIALLAALVPLTVIFELVNIGTLFAFVLVNIGVIVLRRTRPDMERSFRVPFVPVVPIIGALLCVYLMAQLPLETWLRFVGWLVVGLVLYFAYGKRHSRLQHGEVVVTEDS
jgi:basic amino acid/polyamine antiporter, APA family